MRHHEVDGVRRLAAVVAVEIRRAREPRRKRSRRHVLDSHLVLVLAQVVAVDAVPLRPLLREVPDLVAVTVDRPRLRDQVDPGATGIRPRTNVVPDPVEGRAGVELVVPETSVLARVAEHRRQIEPESVDAERVGPVQQRVDDHPLRGRAAGVHVPANAGVVVVELHVRRQRVIGRVVETAERHHVRRRLVGAVPQVALAGVVVDDVDVDLDAGVVKRLHHCLEFLRGSARSLVRRIPPVRSKKVERRVTPIVVAIGRRRAHVVRVVLRFLHRQELDCGDPE